MAIRYSGLGIEYSTFTLDASATRTELVDAIKAKLTNQADGWTVASGASGDWVLQSQTTAQGLAMRVRIWDPGSGNCCRVAVRNVGGTITHDATPAYLLPVNNETWRVIVTGYQAFIFVPGASPPRKFVAFGVPYLESFLDGVITECIWLQGNGGSDTDTVGRPGYRTILGSMPPGGSVAALQEHILNGSSWAGYGFTADGSGAQQLMAMWSSSAASGYATARWHGGDYLVTEPLITWGATGETDVARIRGQLWDAAIFSEAFTIDETDITWDDDGASPPTSYLWHSVTGSNVGGASWAPGSLCLRRP